MQLDDADGSFLEELLQKQMSARAVYPIDEEKWRKALGQRVRLATGEISVSVPEEEQGTEVAEPEPSEVRESIKTQALLARIGKAIGLMRFRDLAILLLGIMSASCAMFTKHLPTSSEFLSDDCGGNGVDLYYEEYGKGDPILFLHGLGMSSFTWRNLVEPLAREHRLILVDLKGFGNSPKPGDGRYSIYDQARLICRFIFDHDLSKVTLVGNSLGGGVALATTLYLSAHAPKRQERLILIDTIAYEQDLPLFVKVLATPALGPLVVATMPNHLQVRTIMKLAYFDDEAVPEESVERYANVLNEPGAREALVQTARQIIPPDLDGLTARYSRIGYPTLILWGEQDAIVPLDIGRRLHESIPNSRLVIMPDTGHVPQEERPQATLAEIEAFVSRN